MDKKNIPESANDTKALNLQEFISQDSGSFGIEGGEKLVVGKERTRSVVIFFIGLIFFVAVFLFFLGKKNRKAEKVNLNNPETLNDLVPDVDIQKLAVMKRSVLSLPTYSAVKANEHDLPLDLVGFLPETASEKEISYLNFKTGEKGYYVKYNFVIRDLAEHMFRQRLIAKDNKWSILYSTRAEWVSVMELENKKYQTRILYSKIKDPDIYQVEIISKAF